MLNCNDPWVQSYFRGSAQGRLSPLDLLGNRTRTRAPINEKTKPITQCRLFTVIVIVLSFGFVYWMTQFRRGDDMVDMTCASGSANGLSVGSAVRFKRIPVGSVRALNSMPTTRAIRWR